MVDAVDTHGSSRGSPGCTSRARLVRESDSIASAPERRGSARRARTAATGANAPATRTPPARTRRRARAPRCRRTAAAARMTSTSTRDALVFRAERFRAARAPLGVDRAIRRRVARRAGDETASRPLRRVGVPAQHAAARRLESQPRRLARPKRLRESGCVQMLPLPRVPAVADEGGRNVVLHVGVHRRVVGLPAEEDGRNELANALLFALVEPLARRLVERARRGRARRVDDRVVQPRRVRAVRRNERAVPARPSCPGSGPFVSIDHSRSYFPV